MKLKNITLFILIFGILAIGSFSIAIAEETIIEEVVIEQEIIEEEINLEEEILEEEIIEENQYCPGDGILSIEEFLNVPWSSFGTTDPGKGYDFTPILTEEGLVYSNTELYWTLVEQAGTISVTVRNHTGCIMPMSLSAYSVFDQVLSNQEFFDGTGLVNIPSSDTDTILTIDLPNCMAQIDLWYGLHPEVLEDINYWPYVRMWAFIYNDRYSYSDATGKFCGQETENIAPVANAGPDQTITLPTNSTNLDGSLSTDSDGTIVSYVWTFVTGPTNIDPNDVVNPNIGGLVEGTYVFELTVTDDDGATGTDTVAITINPEDTGGGGGGGSSSGSRRSGSRPAGEVLGVQTTVCDFAIDTYMRQGYNNNKEQVKILQSLLNKYVGTELAIDGFYGPKTEEAVNAFQIKYRDTILEPWNIEDPTGIFFRTSLVQAQNLECPDLEIPIPTNLINWSQSGTEVPSLIPVRIPFSFNYYGI